MQWRPGLKKSIRGRKLQETLRISRKLLINSCKCRTKELMGARNFDFAQMPRGSALVNPTTEQKLL